MIKLVDLVGPNLGLFTTELEGVVITFAFDSGSPEDQLFRAKSKQLLLEAKHRGQPLGGQYSARLDKAHSSTGQDHLHIYAKNNQLFAINKDGTAHDRSHGAQIPNRVAAAIRAEFPDFRLPTSGIIEAALPDVELKYCILLEAE